MALKKVREVEPPRGLRLALFRAPSWLYRLGLGALLGQRTLLLSHTGRKTGRTRHTVLEVMQHDPANDTYVISSGWGTRAQWYQNLRAEPRARIQVAARRVAVEAAPVDPSHAEQLLIDYAQRHPRAPRAVARMLGYTIDDTEEDLRELSHETPMLTLRVTGE